MILITGGTGYIGSHTAVELLQLDKQVVIADDLSNSNINVINKIELITGKKVIFENIDLNDEKKLFTQLDKYSISTIIHFAAFKAVGESVEQPLKYYRNNLGSLINILEFAKKKEINSFIFSSSATVYGIPERVPIEESFEIGKATNAYGSTKIIGEQIIRDFSKVCDIKFTLLRYFNPIGAHPSGLIGDLPSGTPNNLLPYVTQVAQGLLPFLKVFGNDYKTKDGSCIRDYVHVVDLAKGHAQTVLKNDIGEKVRVYNMGTGIGTSVFEIIEAFKKVNNIEIPYKISPRREGDLAEMFANCDLAKKELNWEAQLNIDDMLKSAWNFQKNVAN